MTADALLEQELVTLAFCWRLERRDGVAIGLTSHDRDIAVNGFPYRAAPGLVPSAIKRGIGLDVESMDLQGALTSDAIREADLRAGRWDDAMLWLHLTEWSDPGSLWLELMRGNLGTVEQNGASFAVELRGPNAALTKTVVPETSPTCRARFGDTACRMDLGRYRRVVRVTDMVDDKAVVMGGGLPLNVFRFGTLRWLEGDNCGLVQSIVAQDAASVTLADVPPFAVKTDSRAVIVEGCDKRIGTCATRFDNALNFQGEPYLPGSDLLTRYPGAN